MPITKGLAPHYYSGMKSWVIIDIATESAVKMQTI